MTHVTSNTAALSLLQQSPMLPGAEAHRTAADAILDIVAGKVSSARKTAPAAPGAQAPATTTPREAGGSVSGEISRGQLSGMAAGGKIALMPNREVGAIGSVSGGTPADDGGDNAIRFATGLVAAVNNFNKMFHLVSPPTRDEYNNQVFEGQKERLSKGQDLNVAKKQTEAQLRDEAYNNAVDAFNSLNKSFVSEHRYASETVSNLQGWLSGGFNAETKISYDEKGEAKLEAFEFSYGNGQKISYHDNGSMSVTKADGTTVELNSREVRLTGGNRDGRLYKEK